MTTSLQTPAHGEDAWHVRDDAPFVSDARLPESVATGELSRFGDSTWDLCPLSQREHDRSLSVNWDLFPASLRSSFRRAGWTLINLPTPQELLERVGTNRVEWPSPATSHSIVLAWRRFADWLVDRGITALSTATKDDLVDYALHISTDDGKKSARRTALSAVTSLWGYAPHLPPRDRIPMPPWEAEGMKHYLPTDDASNENSTPPIHPAVMSPLLIWSLRFVDFADDIIAAWEEHQRLDERIRGEANLAATAPLVEFLERHVTENRPLPGHVFQGKHAVARPYLAGLFGTSTDHVRGTVNKYRTRLAISTETPLDTPIHGLLHGKPWTTHINYQEAPILMLRLVTACMVTVLYLSGVRPGEALGLQVGCCPEPETDAAGSIRYELHGLHFKGARDEDGQPARAGAPRQTPWTVILPVVHAIRILERLSSGGLLFPVSAPWTESRVHTNGRRRTGQALTSGAANHRIATFIAWVNTYADQHDLPTERIPADPDGSVAVKRLRRTIAWHIARLPGGRIALAVQYGHLRASVVAEGYSGRSRQGLRRVLDIETARAMADHLDTVADRFQHGEGVSGPAAGRMIQAARDARARFQGTFLTPKQAEALLTEPKFHVYDNPEAFLTCNNDPAKALCHPERTQQRASRNLPPATDRCDPACANISRTDTHIQRARDEISWLTEEATIPLTPTPLRERHKQRIATLRQLVDRHERTKTTATGGDDD